MIDKKKLMRMSRAWKSGVTGAQFAQRFGFRSNCLADLRRRYPDLFPLRGAAEDKLDEAMKKRGYVAITPRQWATSGWVRKRR